MGKLSYSLEGDNKGFRTIIFQFNKSIDKFKTTFDISDDLVVDRENLGYAFSIIIDAVRLYAKENEIKIYVEPRENYEKCNDGKGD